MRKNPREDNKGNNKDILFRETNAIKGARRVELIDGQLARGQLQHEKNETGGWENPTDSTDARLRRRSQVASGRDWWRWMARWVEESRFEFAKDEVTSLGTGRVPESRNPCPRTRRAVSPWSTPLLVVFARPREVNPARTQPHHQHSNTSPRINAANVGVAEPHFGRIVLPEIALIVAASARRGLNPVDDSLQTDREATDLSTVDPAPTVKVTKPSQPNLPQCRKLDNASPPINTDARTRMLRGRNTMTTCGQLTCNLPGIGRIAQDEQQPVSKVFLVWLWVTFSPNG
ncbi:hypothetical protein F443_10763 [Phytophthora nicotianae P1569]|uniref:Uncharacterized protein n=1 Tax=Phytophthora nicotianae P1569 TaxID=1317065 RepID=V9F1B6_PHYNI|nr:hypothetical protein F443_10763 [Phytophthora nicotianae P1569]